MKNYDNIYIAAQTFDVKNRTNDLTITKGEYLQLQSVFNNYGLEQCLYNNTYIYVDKNDVEENCKNIVEAYQENFTHLDKNHLYFGQINKEEIFVIGHEGKTKYYQKIGEYITSQGKKYNAVEVPDTMTYFDATEKESFEQCRLTYFKQTDLIKKDEFTTKEALIFNLGEAIDVCEYLVNSPRMLEVIECFFTGQDLTQELEVIYEKYHEDRSWDIEQGMGFTSHKNKALDEITEEILNSMNRYPKERYNYYVNYVLKNHVNNPEFNKEKILKDIQNYGYILLWCQEEFKNDREIVLSAVKQNPQLIVFASEEIRSLIGQSDPVKSLESLVMNEKFENIYPAKNTNQKRMKI